MVPPLWNAEVLNVRPFGKGARAESGPKATSLCARLMAGLTTRWDGICDFREYRGRVQLVHIAV